MSYGEFIVAIVVKNPPANAGREDPLEEGMQPTPIFLPGESHGQRSLVESIELDMTKVT